MTRKELLEQMIKVYEKDQNFCSQECSQLRFIDFTMDGNVRFKCLLNDEELKIRLIWSMDRKIRSKLCKDLFRTDIK